MERAQEASLFKQSIAALNKKTNKVNSKLDTFPIEISDEQPELPEVPQ